MTGVISVDWVRTPVCGLADVGEDLLDLPLAKT